MTAPWLRVGYDDAAFTIYREGGVSRYFVELIRNLPTADPGLQLVLPWRWTVNTHAVDAGLGRRPPLPATIAPRVAKKVASWGNRRAQHEAECDVWHRTFYDNKRRLGRGSPLEIVSVYDMIPERFPEMFVGGYPHGDKIALLQRADLILSISESTANDLTDFVSVTAPVVTVHLGVGAPFQPGTVKLPALPERYVLFVGQRRAYKDFAVLAKAFSAIVPSQPDLSLVVVGGLGSPKDAELAAMTSAARDRLVYLQLSDAELASAYEHAAAFVFPSRYEGFGLPTLEAMAMGAPTILARASALVEVGGDAALYFPPGDHTTLAEQLEAVLGDSRLAADLSARGREHAATKTWAATAAGTAAAYRSLV